MVALLFPLTWALYSVLIRITTYLKRIKITPKIATGAVFLLLLTFPTVAVVYSSVEELTRPSEQPFICIILVDTLRVDHCSCYGYERETTPYLDGLAGNGTIFENCISQAPWTKPSVATLFTGLPSITHKTVRIFDSIPGESYTMAERLNDAGYVTVANSSNFQVTPDFNFQQGFDFFITDQEHVFLSEYLGCIGAKTFDRAYEFYLNVKHRQTWKCLPMKEIARNQTEQVLLTVSLLNRRPTFIYIHYMEPHVPYMPSGRFGGVFGPPVDDPRFFPDACNVEYTFLTDPESRYDITESQKEELVRRYDCEIRQNDDAISPWVNIMDRKNRWDDSLLIFVADHGEEFMDHGFLYHNRALYQESIHVPLIIWDSRVSKQPSRVSPNVMVADIMPTVLDWAATAVPSENQDFYGISLLPSLNGQDVPEGRRIIAEIDWDVYATRESKTPERKPDGYIVSESIIIDNYKLIRDHNRNKVLIYDLASDPNEVEPLSGSNGKAESLSSLEDTLNETLSYWERKALTSEAVKVDEETWNKMRDLGYVK
ncbi:MAG: sulfatase [Candidatus Coatesbacteria bacterium]|nr:MAG: sulfatase [Candidatus Coatesbacteria bacterium]